MKVSQDQFAAYMNDRLRMLLRSCEAYDFGDYAEAVRLAGSIVKLVGDRTRKSGDANKNFISLSTRLGIKPSHMVDLSLHGAMDQQHLHGPLCILALHLSGASGLVPWLDGFPTHSKQAPNKVPFDKWWTEPVIRDCFGNEFSRQVIIETMRDQEDAHTDGDLLPDYAAMAYSGAIGIRTIEQSDVRFDENPARVAARQIAHEVLRTLVPDLPIIQINTRGLQVNPVMLYEVMQEDAEGNFQQVLDHRAIEFRAENTSSPEVWAEWQKFAQPLRTPFRRLPRPWTRKQRTGEFELHFSTMLHIPFKGFMLWFPCSTQRANHSLNRTHCGMRLKVRHFILGL